jgi:hypothetical protein
VDSKHLHCAVTRDQGVFGGGKRVQRKRKVDSAEGALLRQEEIAFIKALSNIELSPVFLRELRKAAAIPQNLCWCVVCVEVYG